MLLCKNPMCRNAYLPAEASFVRVARLNQDGSTPTDSELGTPWCARCKEPASDLADDVHREVLARLEERVARDKAHYSDWLIDDSEMTRDIAREDPLDLLRDDPHEVAEELVHLAKGLKSAGMYAIDGDPTSGWHALVYALLYQHLEHELGWRYDTAYTALARLSDTFDHRVGRVFLQAAPNFDAYGVALELLDVDALMSKCDSPDLQVKDFIVTDGAPAWRTR